MNKVSNSSIKQTEIQLGNPVEKQESMAYKIFKTSCHGLGYVAGAVSTISGIAAVASWSLPDYCLHEGVGSDYHSEIVKCSESSRPYEFIDITTRSLLHLANIKIVDVSDIPKTGPLPSEISTNLSLAGRVIFPIVSVISGLAAYKLLRV